MQEPKRTFYTTSRRNSNHITSSYILPTHHLWSTLNALIVSE